MTEPLSRDNVIELLNKLGSDSDEDALEAAREVHARITAAGMTWEDLLVSDEAGAGAAADTDDTDDVIDDDDSGNAESPNPEDEATQPTAKAYAKDVESIALIDQLLAKSNISTDLREELKGYKTDIAAGEFEDRDRRYLNAVYKRLSKRR